MSRIYVAGPMRGEVRFNFDHFDYASGRLRARDWLVVNPADISREICGLDPYDLPGDYDWSVEPEMSISREQVLGLDIKALEVCDAIFMLVGWEESEGANIEINHARCKGMNIFFESDGYPSA